MSVFVTVGQNSKLKKGKWNFLTNFYLGVLFLLELIIEDLI